ncbi:TIGR01777 family oxidoreductase [Evansella tamaricis]|uniref:TIGR01777 family oxidoreductase n=1 Tax=Evansella tamaricis TaxID=2069301 RepID=A0ABS6JAP4_9BACI|nr:TIGR01777 family oxidoreductase [Evansella tamaricis]MBU9710749.1 TIGR01777 family oxidoreductase [Evansella tamaricis]
MKIVIAGGSGFIGTALTNKLTENGHHVYILTRKAATKPAKENVTYVEWLNEGDVPEEKLNGVDAIINLAGENLNSGRWTTKKKQEIMESRIVATREIVRIIRALETKPEVLFNGSAIGYYGISETETFTEDSQNNTSDFLGDVVEKWEQEASNAKDDLRVVYGRFGIVLGKEDGALKKMLLPFKLFIGGNLGTGKQWMSWIHLDDLVDAIIFSIETPSIVGPVNMTAPQPVVMKEFGKSLASVLNRPYWAPVPKFLLKATLGEMSILVVEGQRVIPKVLQENGFSFKYDEIKPALEDLLSAK